jgi:hypothetical protein
MSTHLRHKSHEKYKSRIEYLLKEYSKANSDSDIDIESLSHKAKYLAVLISGYLEQAIKEILVIYVHHGARSQIHRYIEETWPISMNMSTKNITKILDQFDKGWGNDFTRWLNEEDRRKSDINDIVSWRNNIAHGNELKTNGVTLISVKEKLITITDLVAFIEKLVDPKNI